MRDIALVAAPVFGPLFAGSTFLVRIWDKVVSRTFTGVPRGRTVMTRGRVSSN